MERAKSLKSEMKWQWLVADAMFTLLILLVVVMMMVWPHGVGKQIGVNLKAGAALLVGAADAALDTSSVITKVPPVYPAIARQMSITGTVEVNITVDDSGKVTEALAVNGPAMLRASAEAAIKQWKFKSGGKGKVAVTFSK
jgi:TonB family protein